MLSLVSSKILPSHHKSSGKRKFHIFDKRDVSCCWKNWNCYKIGIVQSEIQQIVRNLLTSTESTFPFRIREQNFNWDYGIFIDSEISRVTLFPISSSPLLYSPKAINILSLCERKKYLETHFSFHMSTVSHGFCFIDDKVAIKSIPYNYNFSPETFNRQLCFELLLDNSIYQMIFFASSLITNRFFNVETRGIEQISYLSSKHDCSSYSDNISSQLEKSSFPLEAFEIQGIIIEDECNQRMDLEVELENYSLVNPPEKKLFCNFTVSSPTLVTIFPIPYSPTSTNLYDYHVSKLNELFGWRMDITSKLILCRKISFSPTEIFENSVFRYQFSNNEDYFHSSRCVEDLLISNICGFEVSIIDCFSKVQNFYVEDQADLIETHGTGQQVSSNHPIHSDIQNNESKIILVSDAAIESFPRIFMTLSKNYGVEIIDYPFRDAAQIIINEFTCIKIVSMSDIFMISNRRKLILEMSKLSCRFHTVILLLMLGSSLYPIDKELEVIQFFKSFVKFPCNIVIRSCFEKYMSEAIISLQIRESKTLKLLKNEEVQLLSKFLNISAACDFLQSFPSINIYVALHLLVHISFPKLAAYRGDELKFLFTNCHGDFLGSNLYIFSSILNIRMI
jgi:hypothetical protein